MSCSIYGGISHGPVFGGGNDIYIASNSNSCKNSHSTLSHSFGKNEGATPRDLTKELSF
jgi:hypothetical protein